MAATKAATPRVRGKMTLPATTSPTEKRLNAAVTAPNSAEIKTPARQRTFFALSP